MKTACRGFTLVELLVVVALAGVLAAVAFPSYQTQVRKGKRSEAKTALMAVLQAQEKYRANCPQYAGELGAEDACIDTAHTLLASAKSATGLYTLAVTAGDATGFAATATATAGSGQAKDTGCALMTLTLAQGVVATTPLNCW